MGKVLFVRNLSPRVDSSALEDLFTTVGDVESAVVKIDSTTERRVGYVKMATEQAARDCIDRFHGYDQGGQALVVTEDKPHVPNPNFAKARKRSVAKGKARA